MIRSSDIDFIAPEVLMGKLSNEKSDVWSLGAVIYILAFRKNPFNGNSIDEKLPLMKQGKISEYNNYYTYDFITCIKKFLSPNADDRPGIKEIYRTRWFNSYLKLLNLDLKSYRQNLETGLPNREIPQPLGESQSRIQNPINSERRGSSESISSETQIDISITQHRISQTPSQTITDLSDISIYKSRILDHDDNKKKSKRRSTKDK